MLNLERAFKDDRLIKGLTGLSKVEFDVLLPTFKKVLFDVQNRKDRQRAVGGGAKGHLPDARQKLFYILFYMKVYPTFDVAAFIFGTVRSITFDWTKKYMPLLEKALGRLVTLPKRQIRSVEEFAQLFPGVKDIFIDGTERPVQRPRKSKGLKRKYSGKKKRHTRKNQLFCSDEAEILFVSPSKDGRLHDSKQMKKCSVMEHVPKELSMWADKAFPKDMAKNGNAVLIPHKKPQKKELTPEQKEENKVISSFRMVVEHAIGGVKRFRCMTDPFRNKLGKDDQMIIVAAALWNLHLLCKI